MSIIPLMRMVKNIQQGTLLNQDKTINLVVDGHSFVSSATFLENYLPSVVNTHDYNDFAVAGSNMTSIGTRAATVDAKIVQGKKNVLVLWIGVNDVNNTAGLGATVYGQLKTYIQNRLTSGWSECFVYTMTPSTASGRGAQYEIERGIFNNSLRTDLTLLGKVTILDTDTVSELSNPANTTYYSDTLHPTAVGAYFAGLLFKTAITNKYGVSFLAKVPTEFHSSLSLIPHGTGAALATIKMNVSERTILVLNDNADFYVDINGLFGASKTFVMMPGTDRTVYVKCSSSTASMSIDKDTIGQIVQWLSPDNAPTLSGVITPLSSLYRVAITGKNSLTGNIGLMDDLQLIGIDGNANNFYSVLPSLSKICQMAPSFLITLTSDQVNEALAKAWAGRDNPRLYTQRYLDLRASGTSGAPTGQGLIDKANLQAYRTPNMEADKALWTVLTR